MSKQKGDGVKGEIGKKKEGSNAEIKANVPLWQLVFMMKRRKFRKSPASVLWGTREDIIAL